MENGSYPMIDAHCDTLFELWDKGGSLRENTCVVSLDKLPRKTGYCQFFAVWLDDESVSPYDDARQMIDLFYRELDKNTIRQIKRAADFERAFAEEKVGAMLTIENGRALEGKLSNLQFFYDLGVRAMTLTWNKANELADGIMTESGGGLTDFGRDVVREMNRLGMMIDVSHLSERGFWDVLEISELPVMASHSNSRVVASHPRNVTDEQIRALSETGGMIGLNLYPAFLTDGEEASLADCLRHIEHIAAVGGENCLGLGSDFDGFSGALPKGIKGPEDYVVLFKTLKDAGFSNSFLEKLACKNWIKYAKKVLK